MILFNPYVILAGATAWGASIAAAGYTGYRAGQDNVQAQMAREARIVQQIERKTAEAIAGIEVQHVSVTQPLRTEIRTRVEYRECVHSDGVMQLVNEAITGQPAGGSVVPTADAADR